jgi:4-hydroxythreonine-4-phosphate dehydrogenase
MNKPIIVISPGDPAGIGPEVTVKALNDPQIYEGCRPMVVCDLAIMKQAIELCQLGIGVNPIERPEQGMYSHGIIDVLDMGKIDMKEFSFNKISGITGKASVEYVIKAIELAMQKKVDAIVTGPIHKEAIKLGGYDYAGHTEILAHYTKTRKYAMMLADKDFRVVHVNTHVSMLEAIKRTTKERILNVIQLTDEALKKMGIEKPRIAINGLNPHAGENGLFGDEEIRHITPAILEARKQGINADGPHPPDTIFPKMKGGQYDVVVCMYHDQGHIPVKLMGFQYDHQSKKWEEMSGVNITLGLPIIRVSVDHGTAFDKGGKGEANPGSMKQAIRYAIDLALNS